MLVIVHLNFSKSIFSQIFINLIFKTYTMFANDLLLG